MSIVQPLLKAAGVNQIHYGGGGTADQYDWQNNTEDNDPKACGPAPTVAAFSPPCGQPDALDFSDLSANARALGAQTFATVNYGSGSPALAAAWVKQSLTAGQGVAQWSIGNEDYGCWEYNAWLADYPEDYPGYVANANATCPMNQPAGKAAGMEIMAKSYAYNAGQYMIAMKAADPNAQLGVPWAFDYTVGGASVADNQIWNTTVLGDDKQYISFVEPHWYPFGFLGDAGASGNPSVQKVLQSVEDISAQYKNIRAELDANGLPNATVTVGETGVSYQPTNIPCTPAGALFASGDVLSWLAAGAKSVDWWPLDTGANSGTTCANPDEGMFTEDEAAPTPDTAYTGYLLASRLAKPNAKLSSLAVTNLSDPGNTNDVIGFQSVLPDGQVAVALINTNTSYAQKISVSTSLAGTLATESYSAGNQNAAYNKIVDGTSTASAIARNITIAPESILVLQTYKPSSMSLGAVGGDTFKAGAKVSLTGKLSLNNAPAPAGVTVRIYRRVSGSNTNSATLTAKTTAGGAFTATDIPPAHGNYVYEAEFLSNTYQPALASFLVHVTALTPTLKLTVSAKSVKPGQKVTVTATLAASHVNRTLVIYEESGGHAKKVIKRATINSKGQLSVVCPVKANTTFIVIFAGDTWYTSGSATAAVKA